MIALMTNTIDVLAQQLFPFGNIKEIHQLFLCLNETGIGQTIVYQVEDIVGNCRWNTESLPSILKFEVWLASMGVP